MIQKITCDLSDSRVETGAVQFNDDWPGLFIRGDNAFGLAMYIQMLDASLSAIEIPAGAALALYHLKSLAKTINEEVVLHPPPSREGSNDGNSIQVR